MELNEHDFVIFSRKYKKKVIKLKTMFALLTGK